MIRCLKSLKWSGSICSISIGYDADVSVCFGDWLLVTDVLNKLVILLVLEGI